MTKSKAKVAAEQAAADEAKSSRRGRPRPQDVITRDEAVLNVLVKSRAPMTREQLATELGAQPSHVYLSLYRLRRDGHVVRDQHHHWALTSA